ERGQIIHDVLYEFLKLYPEHLPDKPAEKLLGLAREKLGLLLNNTSVRSFWWPKIEKIADGFVRLEQDFRQSRRTIAVEQDGRYEKINDFILTGKTDRVDQTKNGDLIVIDYKTGQIPSWSEVEEGFAPQLLL